MASYRRVYAYLEAWNGTWPPPGSREERALSSELVGLTSAIAIRLCGRGYADVAEDIASEACIAVVQRLRAGKGSDINNLPGYVTRAVTNRFVDDARTATRRRELHRRAAEQAERTATSSPSPEHAIVDRAAVDDIVERLVHERPRMKDADVVVRGHRLIEAGFSKSEAAEILGHSLSGFTKKLNDYAEAVVDLRWEGVVAE